VELQRILALRGPNIWGPQPFLEVQLVCTGSDEGNAGDFPGFRQRLNGLLPALEDPGANFAEALARVAEHLQALAWRPAGASRVRGNGVPGGFVIALPFEEETLARECLAGAQRLCAAARADQPFDVEAERKRLRALAEHVALGPSTEAIAQAARQQGIPVRRIGEYNLLQLGQGVHQRRVWTAETDRTSAIAEVIAKDKEQTRLQLKAVGVPVPDGRPVSDADDAWSAAEDIGLPVVVKPLDGNHGRGVSTNLKTVDQVRAAYALARKESERVVVEKHAQGDDFRLLVIGDRLAAAAHRRPAQVSGDGAATIRQLVDEVNKDPRRGDEHATSLSKIYLDDVALEVLREQGHTPDSIPPAGERVLIRRNANLSTGGTAADVTDFVHPDTAAQAVEAALAIGLDIAGVDVVAHNIGRPLTEQGGVVVEVNAGPGLRMHLDPSSGKAQPVGQTIITMMFPAGQNGRIPLVGILGPAGEATSPATRLMARMLGAGGATVGRTSSSGVYLDDRRLIPGEGRNLAGVQAILFNPASAAAVLEVTAVSILESGLGFDHCDVAVVLDGGDCGDGRPEQSAEVVRTLVGTLAATGTAVLVAEGAGARAAAFAADCPGSVVYVAHDERHPLVIEHRRTGGRAAFPRERAIVLAAGEEEHLLAPQPGRRGRETRAEPQEERATPRVEHALAAAAAAWVLGIPIATIGDVLASCATDEQLSPEGSGLPRD
jgi:cyanophycin synthetase